MGAKEALHQGVVKKHLFLEVGDLVIILGDNGALVRTKVGVEGGEFMSFRDAESIRVLNTRKDKPIGDFMELEEWLASMEIDRKDKEIKDLTRARDWQAEKIKKILEEKVAQGVTLNKCLSDFDAAQDTIDSKRLALDIANSKLEATEIKLAETRENLRNLQLDYQLIKATAEDAVNDEKKLRAELQEKFDKLQYKLSGGNEDIDRIAEELDKQKKKPPTKEEQAVADQLVLGLIAEKTEDGKGPFRHEAKEIVTPPLQKEAIDPYDTTAPLADKHGAKKAFKTNVKKTKTVKNKLGAGIEIPTKIVGDAGTTCVTIVPTSDKEIQERFKSLNEDGRGIYGDLGECLLCNSTGFSKVAQDGDNPPCPRCNGKGMFDRTKRKRPTPPPPAVYSPPGGCNTPSITISDEISIVAPVKIEAPTEILVETSDDIVISFGTEIAGTDCPEGEPGEVGEPGLGRYEEFENMEIGVDLASIVGYADEVETDPAERPTKRIERLKDACPSCGEHELLSSDDHQSCMACKWNSKTSDRYKAALDATSNKPKPVHNPSSHTSTSNESYHFVAGESGVKMKWSPESHKRYNK